MSKLNTESSNWKAWSDSDAGSYILHWEQNCFDRLVDEIFGSQAVQIGLSEIETLRKNRINNRFLIDTAFDNDFFESNKRLQNNFSKKEITFIDSKQLKISHLPTCLVSDLLNLPLANQSVDLIVLPHTLETCTNPHALLREVERILIPSGYLIISSFNPSSLWVLKQRISQFRHESFIPNVKEFITSSRIKDWLKLLSFDIVSGLYGCYQFPFNNKKNYERFKFMELAGDRWWPIFGAIYIIVSQKRENCLNLVGQKWHLKPIVSTTEVIAKAK